MNSAAPTELFKTGGFVEKAITPQDNARKNISIKITVGRNKFLITRSSISCVNGLRAAPLFCSIIAQLLAGCW